MIVLLLLQWLTAVCQIRVNMVAPAKPRKEGLFALAQLPTEEHSVMVSKGRFSIVTSKKHWLLNL